MGLSPTTGMSTTSMAMARTGRISNAVTTGHLLARASLRYWKRNVPDYLSRLPGSRFKAEFPALRFFDCGYLDVSDESRIPASRIARASRSSR